MLQLNGKLFSQLSLIIGLNGRSKGFASQNSDSPAITLNQLGDIDSSISNATKVLVFFIILVMGFYVWASWSEFVETAQILRSHIWGNLYIALGQLMLFSNLAVFIWRFVLVSKYRPAKEVTDKQLLSCTVVVPAYNESKQVLHTLRSVAQSNFPADKLQIIAIDDGSKDDTWFWIEKAAMEFPGRIEKIRQPRNFGKRRALYDGFIKSTGEILVTIDSDSLIESQTLRRMVSPFHDRQIGAVAGNVRVLNEHEGLIPQMLDVSFAYSFEFIRSSQSMVNSVFCTPGALAAYRKKPLMKILNDWMAQTFFGSPANIGEDRALTNFILRTGHHVTFQSNAIVYTNVPVKYKGLCKMFLRWARSNIRELLVMGGFIFGKFRNTPATGARINFIMSWLTTFVPQILLIGLLWCILWRPEVFLPQVLLGSAIAAIIPAIFYYIRRKNSNAILAFAYSIFWVTALSWIGLYSILTAHNNRWMTRDIIAVKPPAIQPGSAGFTARSVA